MHPDTGTTSSPAPARSGHARCGAEARRNKRELAKLGMTVCLGVLVVTGLCRSRTSRRWHAAAGVALVGLSAWHHFLYPPPPRDGA